MPADLWHTSYAEGIKGNLDVQLLRRNICKAQFVNLLVGLV